MKFLIIPIFIVPVFLFGQTPINDPNWSLLWVDNFNTINQNVWEVTNEYDHYGEAQVYLDDNVTIEDVSTVNSPGNNAVVLNFKHEPYSCTNVQDWACNWYNYAYQSGCIQTKPSSNLKFGYIEARMKVPYGVGLWPAFWLFGEDPLKPANDYEEIDIFEINAGRVESCPMAMGYAGDIHYQSYLLTGLPPYGITYQGTSCHENIQVAEVDDYRNWHLYGLEWTPNKIIWYIDGNIVRVSQNQGLTHFEKIIFNVAKSNYTPMSGTTIFPAKMYIDYIKVYKPLPDFSNNVSVCSYNFNNPLNVGVKGSVLIGGLGCNNIVPLNSSHVIRASTSIEIKGDFTVPLGSSLYLDVNSSHY